MFVELIEFLRCPRGHEESALIAAASRSANRLIVDGTLGCPMCNAEFPIEGGVATFAPAAKSESEPASPDTAMRLAAFLGLTDARGFALLSGRWTSHAHLLSDMVDTPIVLIDPPHGVDVSGASAVIRCGGIPPVAAASARALALDPAVITTSDVARFLEPGGRIVAPASAPVPAGIEEIARDERDWVGAASSRQRAPTLVPLRRAK